jgi:hypothetical protein
MTPVRSEAGATAKIRPCDASAANPGAAVAYDANVVKNPPVAGKSENEPASS